jgi:hypothetical protein
MWSPDKRFCTLWWWHGYKPSSCNVLHTYASWNTSPKGNSAFLCMWSLLHTAFTTLLSPSHGCSYFASTHGMEPDTCRVLYTFWESLWCGTLKWILSLVFHYSRPSIVIPENVHKLHVGIFYIVNVTSIKTSYNKTQPHQLRHTCRLKIRWLQWLPTHSNSTGLNQG